MPLIVSPHNIGGQVFWLLVPAIPIACVADIAQAKVETRKTEKEALTLD